MKDFYEERDETYMIFASNLSEFEVHKILSNMNLPYKKLHGKYNGKEETSYITNLAKGRDLVLTSVLDRQESVLVLGEVDTSGFRKAYLHTPDTSVYDIGYFKPVTKDYAEQQNGYTYDPTQDQYFVAEK